MLFNQSVELLSSDLGIILLLMQYKVSVNTVLKGFYHLLKKVKNGIACFWEKAKNQDESLCIYDPVGSKAVSQHNAYILTNYRLSQKPDP